MGESSDESLVIFTDVTYLVVSCAVDDPDLLFGDGWAYQDHGVDTDHGRIDGGGVTQVCVEDLDAQVGQRSTFGRVSDQDAHLLPFLRQESGCCSADLSCGRHQDHGRTLFLRGWACLGVRGVQLGQYRLRGGAVSELHHTGLR